MQHPLRDHLPLISGLFLLLLGLVVVQPRLLKWARSIGLAHLFASRLQYLLLGFVVSEHGLGLLDGASVRQLDPLVTLGLGVVGLLLGLRWQRAGQFDRRLVQAAVVESLATLALVAVPFFFLLQSLSALSWQQRAVAAALIGSTAAISGRQFFGQHRPQSRLLGALNHVADLNTIIGVLAAGLLLALLSGGGVTTPLEKLLLLSAIGAAGGLCAWLLAEDPSCKPLRTALLLGVLLVTAGTATHLGLPPVAATLLMGITVAHLPGGLAQELSESLAFLDSPFRALLLFIAGASPLLPTGMVLLMVGVFLALRTAGKILGGRVASLCASDLLPEEMGLGLLPSSAVALGLALDFQATAPDAIAEVVVTTAVLGSLFSETAGVWTAHLLSRAHRITDATVEAVARLARHESTDSEEVL